MSDCTLRHAETIKLYESGLSLTDVGRVLGVSHVSIYQRLRQAGIARRSTGKRKPVSEFALALVPGQTITGVAEKAKVARHVVVSRIYYRQYAQDPWCAIQPFSADEKALIREAFDADGLDFPDVIELVQDMRLQSGTQRRTI